MDDKASITELGKYRKEKDKIDFKTDKHNLNSGIFKLMKEDHSIGNIIHNRLVTSKDITFCAYKKPHPTENFIVIKIVTNGKVTPFQALDCCLKDLYIELSLIEEELADHIK